MNQKTVSKIHIQSFPPIATDLSHTLILGTMPGQASLQAGQYYAHPRNAFWKIMVEILGIQSGEPYETRTAAMAMAGIALWDVLQSCVRAGSLDSDIDNNTIVLNDFSWFFNCHPHIRRICFNGTRAEYLYRRHVQPLLPASPDREYIRLPSTSPANAAIRIEEKSRAWKIIAS